MTKKIITKIAVFFSCFVVCFFKWQMRFDDDFFLLNCFSFVYLFLLSDKCVLIIGMIVWYDCRRFSRCTDFILMKLRELLNFDERFFFDDCCCSAAFVPTFYKRTHHFVVVNYYYQLLNVVMWPLEYFQ